MKNLKKSTILVVLVALFQSPASIMAAGSADASAGSESPHQLIERTASALQAKLDGRQDYYGQHPAELHALINDVLLPGFDVAYAGRMVLGRQHWTAASEDQRDRFIAAFYSFLIKTYATAVLNFDQRNLKVQSTASFSESGDRAIVRTAINLDGGNTLQVNYALRQIAADWKIYDVRVDGVSYIQNYRSQFDAEINARGIDSVIRRLEAEAAEFDRQQAAGKAQESV